MVNIKKNKGIVLLAGLMFLLLALLASMSMINNLTLLYKEQTDSLKHANNFYQLESLLKNIENELLIDNPSTVNFQNFITKFDIQDISETQASLQDIEKPRFFIQKEETLSYTVDFLGERHTLNNTVVFAKPELESWLFRIKTWKQDNPYYWIESLVEIFPNDIHQNSNEQDSKAIKQLYHSKRIAWFEGIWDQ